MLLSWLLVPLYSTWGRTDTCHTLLRATRMERALKCIDCECQTFFGWFSGVVARMSDLRLAVVVSNPGHGIAGFSEVCDRSFQVNYLWCNHTQPGIPSGSLNRIPASAWVKAGKVTSAGCQVTQCDPIWYVISRSGEMRSQTSIPFFTFTFFYFFV